VLDELKIVVIGMGYVGIPAAVLLADAGYCVTGLQRRSKRSGWKIDLLNQGRCPIGGEPELPELLDQVVKAGRFKVTADFNEIKDARFILIDVQTPTDQDHQPRYESLREVSHQIGKLLSPGQIVIIESTVAPGTTQNLVKPILEQESGLKAELPSGFGLCFSYERVMVGRLIHNIREYPKIVGGFDRQSTEAAIAMYRRIVKGGVFGTDPMTAEVSKTVENAYRDVQIAFANEVALLCESLGIDVYNVRRFVNGLPNDPSVPHANPVRNMHFPGAGVGGHCLPKDTWLLMHGYHSYGNKDLPGLAENQRYPVSILEGARFLNDWMPVHMVDLLEQALKESGKPISGSHIAVLGYAFLENSDDPRNTPAAPFLQELDRRGFHYKIHDPFAAAILAQLADSPGYPIESDLEAVLRDADALVVMTKHDLYKSLSVSKLNQLLKTRIIVDGRNLFVPDDFVRQGYIFKGVGKGNLCSMSE